MIKAVYRFLNPKFQNVFLDYKVNMKPRYSNKIENGGGKRLIMSYII